jgi:hypothetical protein
MASILLGSVIPILGNIPSERSRLIYDLTTDMRSIATELYDKARNEKDTLVDSGLNRSILGALGT